MAKQCYQIPDLVDPVGHPAQARPCRASAHYVFPDGALARDGAGFSGQFWVHTLWLDAELIHSE